jgi:glycosyltransferase involved in cell wall biosynthesis
MGKLRVVHLYLHLEFGGIESTICGLLPRLNREEFDTRMICTRRRGVLAAGLERQGIRVDVCRLHSTLPLSLSALRLARKLRRAGADVVHAHGEFTAQVATVAARKASVPVVVANFHGVGLFKRRGQLERERRQARMREAVIHVSRRAHEDYLERVRPPSDNGVVIYNGIDTDFFAEPRGEQRLRELALELGVAERKPVLLNVARMHRDKNQALLLEAFRKVLERHPAATLLLLGRGRRRTEIEGRIRALDLQDSVRTLQGRSDVGDLYHLADVGVLASNREGFSIVVLEAMAAGLPQVLTDVGGNGEAVGDTGAAILVPPRDARSLAAALLRVLDDPDRARAMRRAARERALRFSVAEQVARTERLYRELARQENLDA